VSPSPSELFDRLSDNEKVAIDRISELGNDDNVLRDEQLCALVPSEGRRGYLRTLAMQLPSCVGDASLDGAIAVWTAARERVDAETREAARNRGVAAARDRAWLETLTPEVRRSVERQRRRRASRRRRGR
jgi:hypothetical protein